MSLSHCRVSLRKTWCASTPKGAHRIGLSDHLVSISKRTASAGRLSEAWVWLLPSGSHGDKKDLNDMQNYSAFACCSYTRLLDGRD